MVHEGQVCKHGSSRKCKGVSQDLQLAYKRSRPASATSAVKNVIDFAMCAAAGDDECGDAVGEELALEVAVSDTFSQGTVDDMLRSLASVRSAH